MNSLAWIKGELEVLESRALFRSPLLVESKPGPEVLVDGKPVVLACSNNYLGLAADDRVIEAACQGALRLGAGSGASPLVSGLTRAQRELEECLAKFKKTEDCVIFSSGYLANLGVIQALVGPDDAIFSDELNHASIIDGCRLSRAKVVVYSHCDMKHLEFLLSRKGHRRALIVTDSVFSMDGDLAPLPEIFELAERFGAMTVIDEAHGTGVLGAGGRGAIEYFGLEGQFSAVVGTMSKALGSAGGFVAGGHDLANLLRNRARSQIFDTAPAPAAIASTRKALELVELEPERRQRIAELRLTLANALQELGYNISLSQSAIIPVLIGDSSRALELSRSLMEFGVLAPAIRPPSVPAGTARIRLTVMATHSDSHVARVIDAFAAARKRGVV